MPRGRQRRTARRRREILEAALECFTRYGFAATTVEQIRSRSKASTGSIYHHFSGKEELAGELYVEGLRDYQEGLLAELERQPETERGIRAIVAYHLSWVAAHRDWARYLLEMRQAESVVASEEKIRDLNERFFRAAMEWLGPRIRRGELRPMPADICVAVMIGPAQEFTRHWLNGRSHSSISQARRLLADAAWAALRAQGGAE